MTISRNPYLTRIETSPGRVKRLQRQGWEVTAVDRRLMYPNQFHLRKPNPDYVTPEERQVRREVKFARFLNPNIPADATTEETLWYGQLGPLQAALAKAENKVQTVQREVESRPNKRRAKKLANIQSEAEVLRRQVSELEAKIKNSERFRASKRQSP